MPAPSGNLWPSGSGRSVLDKNLWSALQAIFETQIRSARSTFNISKEIAKAMTEVSRENSKVKVRGLKPQEFRHRTDRCSRGCRGLGGELDIEATARCRGDRSRYPVAS